MDTPTYLEIKDIQRQIDNIYAVLDKAGLLKEDKEDKQNANRHAKD